MKLGDWTLCSKLIHKGSIPEIRDVKWRPGVQCWVHFLLKARVCSYKRFQGVVGNVCEVADRFGAGGEGAVHRPSLHAPMGALKVRHARHFRIM